MALSETFRGTFARVRGKDTDSIASSLLKPEPPKRPPHIEDINSLTAAMLEQVHLLEQSLANSSPKIVRRPLARIRRVVY